MIIDSYENKIKILDEFLQNCVFHGWNIETLEKSAINCGILANQVSLIFDNGIFDLTEFYISENNKKTSEKIAKIDEFSKLKIREKINLILVTRFEIEHENKLQLQALFNFYATFDNIKSFENSLRPISLGFKNCYQIADFMWHEINDKSTDFNFYTKRFTLAKIIFQTTIVFMQDNSENLGKTKNYIAKQIDKVMKFEKCKAKLKNFTKEIILNENNSLKSFKDIIKELPFIRLKY